MRLPRSFTVDDPGRSTLLREIEKRELDKIAAAARGSSRVPDYGKEIALLTGSYITLTAAQN